MVRCDDEGNVSLRCSYCSRVRRSKVMKLEMRLMKNDISAIENFVCGKVE